MNHEEALEIVSYKLGLKNGSAALEDPVLSRKTVEQAIQDQANGEPKKIETRDYLSASKVMKEIRLHFAQKEGEEWLAENAKRDGVEVTDSGLQYRVIKEGDGTHCLPTSQVEVHYKGELTDGNVFDSSYDRGEPANFAVAKVIQGWQEGLCLMKKGSHYQFFIPQELGYGDRGSGSSIPPFSVLVFEVELIEIQD